MKDQLKLPPRRYPFGAEVVDDGVNFRVWAPRCRSIDVVLFEQEDVRVLHPLAPEPDGFFSATLATARPEMCYRLRVDGDRDYPDPASHFQPEGVHGRSKIIDSNGFAWTDAAWPGVSLKGQVLYELHIGTFTPEGTWRAAIEKLSHLREVGVTTIEVMPVAEFQGDFGWGYDGVNWFAPTRLYGSPDDFRAFVDAAHRHGLGVILDVVYNHFGPTGNYLGAFSSHFTASRPATDWGDAINYDGENSAPVRDFVTSNVAYWIREFHLDGLRLDATQAIFDDSPEHILTALTRSARQAAGERSILIFAENDAQQACHVDPPEQNGYGMDGLWNDDFHHVCRVAATGHAEFYYADFAGSAQELLSALRWGYLYQGQWNSRQGKYRGSPAWHVPLMRFVHFLQNHDQVANSGSGQRLHAITSPGRHRALTALMLLGPQTPMFFMGQEFSASAPFLFFADHEIDIAALVREGRWEFLRCFPRAANVSQLRGLADPANRATFDACKLNWEEATTHHEALALHKDLLHLRKHDPIFAKQDGRKLEGSVISPEILFLRWFDEQHDDRLLLLNLGRDLHWRPAAEPLIAAPAGCQWSLLWSSESPKYGGSGTGVLNIKEWNIPGHAAIVLRPQPID